MGERVQRVRCENADGEPDWLAVAVRGQHVYIYHEGRRVRLSPAEAVHLLTAVNVCYYKLVTGEYYEDNGRPL